METQSSLPHSQHPVNCPYPDPDQPSPCSPSHFLKIYFNIILASKPTPSKWPLPLRYPHQNSVCTSPLPHTCYVTEINLLINNPIPTVGTLQIKLGVWSSPQCTVQVNSWTVTLTACFSHFNWYSVSLKYAFPSLATLALCYIWSPTEQRISFSWSLRGTPVVILRKAHSWRCRPLTCSNISPTVSASRCNRYFPSSMFRTFLQFVSEKTFWVTNCVYIELQARWRMVGSVTGQVHWPSCFPEFLGRIHPFTGHEGP